MNGPRTTEDLSELAEIAHRIAVQTRQLDLIEATAALMRGLEDLDSDIELAVTTLRRGSNSPSARRQQEQRQERERWKLAAT